MALVAHTWPAEAAERPRELDDPLLYRARAEVCKALVEPKRLMLLDALREGEQSVSQLADRLGCTLANTSQHLAVLRHAGLLESRRSGTAVYYRVSDPAIFEACDAVKGLVKRRLGR